MKKFFILMYVILMVALIIVTPYDLRMSHLLYGDSNIVFKLISDFVYLPIFFIGYLGILYYYQRLNEGISHWLLKVGLGVGTLIGTIALTYIFIRSMRFLPYYLYLSPLFIVIMIVFAWLGSEYLISRNMFEFDYLLSTELGTIVTLFFLVTYLKRMFGRARFYLVVHEEKLFSQWYELNGMMYHRDFYSFPSGHTTFVAITFWFILVTLTVPQFKKYNKITMITVFLWIGLHGYIRILLGEHYLTDVLFSVLLTLVVLHILFYVSMYVSQFLKEKFYI